MSKLRGFGHALSKWGRTLGAIVALTVVAVSVYYSKQGADNSAAQAHTNSLNTCRSKVGAYYITRPNQEMSNAVATMQTINLQESDLLNRSLLALTAKDESQFLTFIPQLADLTKRAGDAEAVTANAQQHVQSAYQSYLVVLNRSNTDQGSFLATCRKLPLT